MTAVEQDPKPVTAPVLLGGTPPALSRRELEEDVFGLRRRVPAGATAVVDARHAALVTAAVAALDGWASGVHLVSGVSPRPTGDAVLLDDADAVVPATPAPSPRIGDPRTPTRWRLYSSGTTGEPRATDHLLASLASSARAPGAVPGDASARPRRWGLLYRPTRMAGLQLILQAWFGGDELVDATHVDGIDAQVAWLAEQGVDAISATPTHWRRILQAPSSSALRLRQVTLGGEIATQPLLDALRAAFGARTTHVYASTEAGATFSVSDGREGFPAGYLDEGPAGTALRVRDGELQVRAGGSSAADADGFVRTDDLVEVRGDRVHFLGRGSGLVNVAGEKVAPEQVEDVLRGHPAVHDALVRPLRSSFTGSLLTAQVVLAPGAAPDVAVLHSELRALVLDELTRYHVPARIDVVPELPVARTGKVQRT
ncbi:ANL family adenylate-forming protein [Cellulomonas sp. URHB0016]